MIICRERVLLPEKVQIVTIKYKNVKNLLNGRRCLCREKCRWVLYALGLKFSLNDYKQKGYLMLLGCIINDLEIVEIFL